MKFDIKSFGLGFSFAAGWIAVSQGWTTAAIGAACGAVISFMFRGELSDNS